MKRVETKQVTIDYCDVCGKNLSRGSHGIGEYNVCSSGKCESIATLLLGQMAVQHHTNHSGVVPKIFVDMLSSLMKKGDPND